MKILSKIARGFLLLTFIILPILICFASFYFYIERQIFVRNLPTTSATVISVELYEKSSNPNKARYTAQIEYIVNDVHYKATQNTSINSQINNHIQKGSIITIRYNPDDPSDCEKIIDDNENLSAVYVFIGFSFMCIMAYLYFKFFNHKSNSDKISDDTQYDYNYVDYSLADDESTTYNNSDKDTQITIDNSLTNEDLSHNFNDDFVNQSDSDYFNNNFANPNTSNSNHSSSTNSIENSQPVSPFNTYSGNNSNSKHNDNPPSDKPVSPFQRYSK